MARVELDVPFFDKLEAKRLGARWDAGRRVWYLPDGMSATARADAMARWCYAQPDIGIRSRRYLLADTTIRCWRCNGDTAVHAIVLPAMHKTLERDGQGQLQWQRHKLPCFLHYVTDLPAAVLARLRARTPHYRMDTSRSAGAYFMNHCAACGLKLGDAGLHREAGGAFVPPDAAAAGRIALQEVPEPFSCNGVTSYGDYFFSAMRRG